MRHKRSLSKVMLGYIMILVVAALHLVATGLGMAAAHTIRL